MVTKKVEWASQFRMCRQICDQELVPPFCVIMANFSDIFYALMPITIATQQDLGKDDYMPKSNWARQAYEIAIRTAVK